MLCSDPPPAPFLDGVRRHVVSPESFAAWRFDVNDIVHVDDAALGRFPAGNDWPLAPELIAVDGDPGVYVRDVRLAEATRRHVPSPEAMDRRRLDWGAIARIELAALEALDSTGAISTRPYLVRGGGPAVYVIDVPPADAGERARWGPCVERCGRARRRRRTRG